MDPNHNYGTQNAYGHGYNSNGQYSNGYVQPQNGQSPQNQQSPQSLANILAGLPNMNAQGIRPTSQSPDHYAPHPGHEEYDPNTYSPGSAMSGTTIATSHTALASNQSDSRYTNSPQPPPAGYHRSRPTQSSAEPSPDVEGDESFRWWIPAEGISRVVLNRHIQRFLGQDAVCKPASQGVSGIYFH
jgi:hypothetical protein